ncbi:MAG: carbonic anhydrase family protein [Janthinobacterium lividum]|uniref:carbonic anhydrase n=2 Tax=Janthinobacterium TaxID=29580 RepID=A0A1E8PV31_9BURK|nr:carbonic anhydrase family protein [Janthinobacterium lividum]OFJ49469.1 carbonate dehydratase [Janthinobacterium lividum]
MRHLSALLACSLAAMAVMASAKDAPASATAAASASASASAPMSASARAAAMKTLTESVKGKGKESKAPVVVAPTAREKEEAAEVDLSERIAARLAEMRATQAARAAARAKRATVVKAAPPPPPSVPRATHWSYEGDSGPENWGKINVDWARCGNGSRQSPIDIRDGMKVELEQISFDYHPSSFNVVDNGHTVQVGVSGGNYITVQNRMFELQQFHFHRPSEERINGKAFEMVVHLVHRDAEGRLAVLALLLERGAPQATIQTVWNNLPLEKFQTMQPTILLDPAEMLPTRRDYYTYMGSLTSPPCSEGVLWLVMKQPVQASPAQMALFSRLYPLNARPIQPANGRIIKESN